MREIKVADYDTLLGKYLVYSCQVYKVVKIKCEHVVDGNYSMNWEFKPMVGLKHEIVKSISIAYRGIISGLFYNDLAVALVKIDG